jgi:hypothetical protein
MGIKEARPLLVCLCHNVRKAERDTELSEESLSTILGQSVKEKNPSVHPWGLS